MIEMDADDEMRLATALKTLQGLVAPLATAITTLSGKVAEAQQAVQAALEDNGAALVGVAERIRPLAVAAGQSATAIETAGREALDALESIDELLDAATNAASPLGGLSGMITGTSVAAHDALKSYVEEWIARQREVLDAEVLQTAAELRGVLAEPVVAKIEGVFDDISEAIGEAVREVLQPAADDLAASFEELLDEFVDRLARGDEETHQENLALRPVLDLLRPPVEALIDQVERVTPLAAMVGMK